MSGKHKAAQLELLHSLRPGMVIHLLPGFVSTTHLSGAAELAMHKRRTKAGNHHFPVAVHVRHVH